MKNVLFTEISRLFFILIVLTVIGYFSGYMQVTLVTGLLLIIIWQMVNFYRISLWLRLENNPQPPQLSGIPAQIIQHVNRLKKRLNKSQNSRQDILDRVEDITRALPNGIILLNKDLTIGWWNRSAEIFLSLQTSSYGQHIIDLLPSMAFGDYILHGDFSTSLEIIHPNNKYLKLNLSAAPFGNNETILVIQDISRLRHLEEIRKDFVDNISHELRTPLTVIAGYLENLEFASDSLPPTFKKAITQMGQQASRMTDLTNDLLMLSRLEALSENAHLTPVSLPALLSEIQTAANELSAGQHNIRIHCANDIFLLGNRSQLSSAISNLVFNAVRHTPTGSQIDLLVQTSNEELDVVVKDDGNGIDAKHLPRLSERFYRVSDSRSSDTGGTGLGLAIVKHILLRHDGNLIIKSEINKGSEFICRFPKQRYQNSKTTAATV